MPSFAVIFRTHVCDDDMAALVRIVPFETDDLHLRRLRLPGVRWGSGGQVAGLTRAHGKVCDDIGPVPSQRQVALRVTRDG